MKNKKSQNDSAIQISVIMPVFNGQSYLREAIDSVLNQTFMDFELIIVNISSGLCSGK